MPRDGWESAGWAAGGLIETMIQGLENSSRNWQDEKAIRAMLAYARSGGPIKRTPPVIPFEARFEHTHICAGSGHGKTQLLQKMILEDIYGLKEGSIVVIDSQGDLINKLMHLEDMYHFRDRLILIDPHNMECPPALNLFDFGLHRVSSYSIVKREQVLNGAIAMYEYLFGGLLGAEVTMRQRVAFRNLARLLTTVEGATVDTMLDFVQSPETIRPYLDRADATTRDFFEKAFFSSSQFSETRHQLHARLWGVKTTPSLMQMFRHKRNKLDMFNALNSGCILLINTAKDLLKKEDCSIFGRFFIALINQAIQERAVIEERVRRPTFLYIDEAHDYFDDTLEQMFSEVRKYGAGITISHQYLGQLSQKLKQSIKASTKTKMVGGLSEEDASEFSRAMGFAPEFLMAQQKDRRGWTTFAVRVMRVDCSNLLAATPGYHNSAELYARSSPRKRVHQEPS